MSLRGEPQPDQAYFDAQFTGVQARIAARERTRRRRTRWMFAGVGAAASLALTGGTIAVIQASETEKSVSVCYQSASLDSPATEVAQAPDDGTVGKLPSMADRVRDAEEQCAVAWQIGSFTPDADDEPVIET